MRQNKYYCLILSIVILSSIPGATLLASGQIVSISPSTVNATAGQFATLEIGITETHPGDQCYLYWGDNGDHEEIFDCPSAPTGTVKIVSLRHVYQEAGDYAIQIVVFVGYDTATKTVPAKINPSQGNNPLGPKSTSNLNPLTCQTFGECFDVIANFLLYIALGCVSLVIIAAAAIFFTGATPDRIALAKKIVLWAVGFLVIMLVVKLIAGAMKGDLTNIKNLPKQNP